MEHIIRSFPTLEDYLTSLPNALTKGSGILYHYSLYRKYAL